MKQNAAAWDRVIRGLGGVAILTCSVFAPLPLLVRAGALGTTGAYLLLSALVGSCLGYKMMGISTCPTDPNRKAT
jgi:Protein of unknown function (DUF2892)